MEQYVHFKVEVKGRGIKKDLKVRAIDLSSNQWMVKNCGISALVDVDYKDYLTKVSAELRLIPPEIVPTFSGWDYERRQFLASNCTIGHTKMTGHVECPPDQSLHFAPISEEEAMTFMLDVFIKVAAPKIMIPLVAAALLAFFKSLLKLKGIILGLMMLLFGISGAGKTTLARLVCSTAKVNSFDASVS